MCRPATPEGVSVSRRALLGLSLWALSLTLARKVCADMVYVPAPGESDPRKLATAIRSLANAPSISTSITCPLIIGGTAASSTLTLESTSGTGTTDALIFKTGSQLERMRIGTDGRLTVNGSGNAAPATLYGRGVFNVFHAIDNTPLLSAFQWTNDTTATTIDIYKSRGTTVGSQVIVQASDLLGALRGFGT